MTGYGLDVEQFRSLIVRPALQRIDHWCPSSENLLLGTCLKESLLRSVKQIGGGPALGPGQMETFTHDDIYITYLNARPDLKEKVIRLASYFSGAFPSAREMIGNWSYAVAMARIRYKRVQPALPPANDALALCQYWKQHYNTATGKGSVDEALPHFTRAIDCRS